MAGTCPFAKRLDKGLFSLREARGGGIATKNRAHRRKRFVGLLNATPRATEANI
jgi:hypothetical protein